MIQPISSQTHMARVMLAVILLTGAAGLTVHAATMDKPLTVKTPGQSVTDDFNIENCTAQAVVDIAASAAKTADDVTKVGTKSITAAFSNKGEANGIWVRPDYPGTVKLADGLNVTVNAKGTGYNSSGIYLEGVDTYHGTPDESDAANQAYIANGNRISDATVQVGNNSTLTVNASVPEGQQGTYVNANALKNHFGHMTVGDYVTLSTETGAFQYNYSNGFGQVYYGNTRIGNHFSSTISTIADGETSVLRDYALYSRHDDPLKHSNEALTQNQLTLGDDASLTSSVTVTDRDKTGQEIANEGAYLSRTDFSIGKGLTVHVSQEGVDDAEQENSSGNSYSVGVFTRGAKGSIGAGMQNRVTVHQRVEDFAYGLLLSGYEQTKGEKPNAKDSTDLTIGSNSLTSVTVNDSNINDVSGIAMDSQSTGHLGDQGKISVQLTDGKTDNAHGIEVQDRSSMDVGSHGNISFVQKGGRSGFVTGVYNHGSSTFTADHGLQLELSYTGEGATSTGVGLYNYNNSSMTVGNDSTVSAVVRNTSTETTRSAVSGIRNILASSQIGNNLSVQVQADNYATAEGIRNGGVDGTPANMTIGDNLSIAVNASSLTGHGTPTVEGIRNGTNRLAGYTFSAGNTRLTVGKNAHITVTAPDKVTDVSALHSFNYAAAELGDGAVLSVNSAAAKNNHVVKADTAGTVTFDGGLTLAGSQNAIYSTGEGSSVTAMGEGRKVILGNLEAADSGTVQLNLNTADSYFRGKSTIDSSTVASTHSLMADTTSADTELTLSNGARWDMAGSSQVTDLILDNGGTVNMQYNPDYQRLDVHDFSGKGGLFLMKTDLDSQTDGDKVYMNGAASGSSGLVQVQDKSFLLGKEVTGTKHLLLITDNSQNATFSGQSMDEGGLWDVTPTIQNGRYVRDVMGDADAKDTEWYLTKLTKTVNVDTQPILGAVDYSYGLYRNSIDTLRQRMGDLRFLKNKRDAAGIWARSYGGELDGPGYDSKYHAIQVGYDYAANDKSLYGFLGERGIDSPHYDYGHSKEHSLAGAIYGTWFGDSGSYTDVVAKWGRDDSNLHTYGPYADSANFRTSSESLSVEYGRTTKLNGHGLFIEPQAQLVLGRLND